MQHIRSRPICKLAPPTSPLSSSLSFREIPSHLGLAEITNKKVARVNCNQMLMMCGLCISTLPQGCPCCSCFSCHYTQNSQNFESNTLVTITHVHTWLYSWETHWNKSVQIKLKGSNGRGSQKQDFSRISLQSDHVMHSLANICISGRGFDQNSWQSPKVESSLHFSRGQGDQNLWQMHGVHPFLLHGLTSNFTWGESRHQPWQSKWTWIKSNTSDQGPRENTQNEATQQWQFPWQFPASCVFSMGMMDPSTV